MYSALSKTSLVLVQGVFRQRSGVQKNYLQALSWAILFSSVLVLSGCGGSGDGSNNSSTDTDTDTDTGTDTDPVAGIASVDPSFFLADALVTPITEESCTLSGGTQTTCYRIEIKGEPANQDIGPFCPPTINATAEEGGIWFDGSGMVYELSGDFILDLPNIYGDSNWQLYDAATGAVNITNTQALCEAGAQPDLPEELQNFCVECSLDYFGGGTTRVFLLPKNPVTASSAGNIGRDSVGVTLNGVSMDPPAPVDQILAGYTIAAFDDCGGHVNPNAGYHYHGATGCTETIDQTDGHASLLGYALDGYGIHAMLNTDGLEPSDLDQCRGHEDDTRGYHYHAASAGENMFVGCLTGEQGSVQ